MHVPPTERERAMCVMGDLLAAGGRLCFMLRHGPGDGQCAFRPVSREEIERLARQRELVHITPKAKSEKRPDCQGSEEVAWQTVCLQLPDDGTGAMPVLCGTSSLTTRSRRPTD